MAKRVHPPSPGIGSDVAGPVAFWPVTMRPKLQAKPSTSMAV